VKKVFETLHAKYFTLSVKEEGDKRELIAHLKDKFFAEAAGYIKEAEAIRKKLLKRRSDAA